MSQENARALLERLRSDPSLMETIQATGSYDDFLAVAMKAGFDLSDLSEEEAREIAAGGVGGNYGELTDDDLDQVAGGFSFLRFPTTW